MLNALSAAKILKDVRARLLVPGAWAAGDRALTIKQDGCGCLFNHFGQVTLGKKRSENIELALKAMDWATRIVTKGWTDYPVKLNDQGPTRLWGVISMLGKAIRGLEDKATRQEIRRYQRLTGTQDMAQILADL